MPKYSFICQYCGKEFINRKNAYRKPKYCSLECSRSDAKIKYKVEIVCDNCGQPFLTTKAKAKNGRRYCSVKCRVEGETDPKKKGVFICEWCGQEFESWAYRPNRFCSAQCRSEFGARQPKLKMRRPESYVTLECEWCGKEYKIHKCIIENPNRNSRFCCKECYSEYQSLSRRGENNPNWNNGNESSYGSNWPRQRRRAIRRDCHTCQICGYKTGGDKILDVHHIRRLADFDGDWKSANKLSNLVCLCRDCHVQVEHGKILLS